LSSARSKGRRRLSGAIQNRFYAKTHYDKDIRALCKESGLVYESFWTLTANPEVFAAPDMIELRAKPGAAVSRLSDATRHSVSDRNDVERAYGAGPVHFRVSLEPGGMRDPGRPVAAISVNGRGVRVAIPS
jgi:hypothetical protein